MQFFDRPTYNGLISAHAALMIFLVHHPGLRRHRELRAAADAGGPDMAFPRLNALSFWMLPMAGVMMV